MAETLKDASICSKLRRRWCYATFCASTKWAQNRATFFPSHFDLREHWLFCAPTEFSQPIRYLRQGKDSGPRSLKRLECRISGKSTKLTRRGTRTSPALNENSWPTLFQNPRTYRCSGPLSLFCIVSHYEYRAMNSLPWDFACTWKIDIIAGN